MSKQTEQTFDKVLGVLNFLQTPGVVDLLYILHDDRESLVLKSLLPDEFITSFETSAKQMRDLLPLKKDPEFINRYFATLKAILGNTDTKDAEINSMFELLMQEKCASQLTALSKIQSAIEDNIENFNQTITTQKLLTPEEKADLLNNAETQSESSGYDSDSDGKSDSGQIFGAPVLPNLAARNRPSLIVQVMHEPEINCTSDFIAEVKKIFPEFNFDSKSGEVITRVPEYSDSVKGKFEDLFEIAHKFADKLASYAKANSTSSMSVAEIKESALQYYIPKLLGQTEMTIAGSATKASEKMADAIKNNLPLSTSAGRVSPVETKRSILF